MASGAYVPVMAIGEVTIYVTDQHGIVRPIVLKGVFYCPALHVNLVSTKRLWATSSE